MALLYLKCACQTDVPAPLPSRLDGIGNALYSDELTELEMEISLAREADIPGLCDLLSELFIQEAEFQPDAAAQRQGLTGIIADSAIGHILVAREGNQVLGMVSLLYSVSTALGGRVAWLEDMVVTGEARGLGVGSVLLEFALKFARDNGCKRITLLTDADNVSAQRFYGRVGFEVSAMMPMRLVL